MTLIGGGHATRECLTEALSYAPILVAADGGASLALAAGLMPEAVIGDFDSLPEADLKRIPAARLHRIAEQETTDFDKALRLVECPLMIGVGFTGARIDHGLAALSGLMAAPHRRVVLLGEQDIVFLAPPRLALDPAPGTRLSLFPMAPVRGRSEGLRWPIAGLDLRPGGRIGTSNAVTGPVLLEVDRPHLMAILPRAALAAVVRALAALPATWPAP